MVQMIENACSTFPDRPALTFKDHVVTYAILKESIDRLAAGLRAIGISRGDRIALMLPNVPHFVISYFALMKLGATVIPIPVFCKTGEIHHQLEDAEVGGIIFWEGSRKHVREAAMGLDRCNTFLVLGKTVCAPEIRLTGLIETHEPLEETVTYAEDETALIIYTAGVTGRSKGAEFTVSAIMANIDSCQQFFRITENDSVAGILPLSLPEGHTLTMGLFLHVGGCIHLVHKFEVPLLLQTLIEKRPTYCVGTPTMYLEMLSAPLQDEMDVSSVKYWISTGDAMRHDVMEQFEARYKGLIIEGYGLTEAGPMVSFNDPTHERKAGSIGLPLPGVDIRLVDDEGMEIKPGHVGEILVKSPSLMKGYLNKPEATKAVLEGGWLHTGDLARLDESGYAFVEVRKKNVIIKGGFSVYPREVERVLLGYPHVQECVVVGLPDLRMGEEIHAAVVLKDGESVSPEEIIAYCREMMAVYKAPQTVTFLKELPKDPSGRVLREEVKQLLTERRHHENP